jgi:hypothetical protein
MDDLLERVVAIADVFERDRIPHSFGGAIAFGYYGSFRSTHDIDINVYLGAGDAKHALESLAGLGVPAATEVQRAQIERDGQTRLHWDAVPIDLFFWNLDFHASCLERRRRYALGGHEIFVLSPEDLIVCKVAFARDKDGRDVVEMLDVMGDELDVAYALQWVAAIVGTQTEAARQLIRALEDRGLLPGG